MAKMMRRKNKRTLYHFDQAAYDDNPNAYEVFELVDADDDAGKKTDQEAELLAKAKGLGIKANRSWGIPKLEAAIAEAESKAAENTTELTEADLSAVDSILADTE